jgi:hypothetical protein
MIDLKVSARRIGKLVSVEITGLLPNPCWKAEISMWYPGDGIVYVRDPEEAQVFIKEYVDFSMGNPVLCPQVVFPWCGNINIYDDYHKKLSVYVNQELKVTVEIQDLREKKEQYIVIAPVWDMQEPHRYCAIVPENSVYPMIYTQVTDPMTKEECEAFIKTKCQKTGQ